jgi:hypothetical protein
MLVRKEAGCEQDGGAFDEGCNFSLQFCSGRNSVSPCATRNRSSGCLVPCPVTNFTSPFNEATELSLITMAVDAGTNPISMAFVALANSAWGEHRATDRHQSSGPVTLQELLTYSEEEQLDLQASIKSLWSYSTINNDNG